MNLAKLSYFAAITPTALKLYLFLEAKGQRGTFTYDEIARETWISSSATISLDLKELTALELLKLRERRDAKGHRLGTEYELLLPKPEMSELAYTFYETQILKKEDGLAKKRARLKQLGHG